MPDESGGSYSYDTPQYVPPQPAGPPPKVAWRDLWAIQQALNGGKGYDQAAIQAALKAGLIQNVFSGGGGEGAGGGEYKQELNYAKMPKMQVPPALIKALKLDQSPGFNPFAHFSPYQGQDLLHPSYVYNDPTYGKMVYNPGIKQKKGVLDYMGDVVQVAAPMVIGGIAGAGIGGALGGGMLGNLGSGVTKLGVQSLVSGKAPNWKSAGLNLALGMAAPALGKILPPGAQQVLSNPAVRQGLPYAFQAAQAASNRPKPVQQQFNTYQQPVKNQPMPTPNKPVGNMNQITSPTMRQGMLRVRTN